MHLLWEWRSVLTWMTLVLFFYSIVIVVIPHQASATTSPSIWTGSKDPVLSAGIALNATTFDNTVEMGNVQKCDEKTFIERPKRGSQTQLARSGCWYSSGIGSMYVAYLVKNGQSIAGKIMNGRNSAGNSSRVYRSTPFSDVLSYSTSLDTGTVMRFLYNPTVDTVTKTNGTQEHTLGGEEVRIRKNNAEGGEIGLQSGTGAVSYSSNGKWVVASSRWAGLFRYNIETRKVINFGKLITNAPGYTPSMALSISDNGRYVSAVNVNQENTQLTIYDLEDCIVPEGDFAAGPEQNCARKVYKPFMQSQIPNFNKITRADFIGNEHILFYHLTGSGSATAYTPYIMTAPGADSTPGNYIALGDSFSSGEGAGYYEAGTDASENKCHLSKKSYPYLINDYLDLSSFHSVACSGATIYNVYGGNRIEKDDINNIDLYTTNQYIEDDIPSSSVLGRAWHPGYDAQISKLTSSVDIVTVGMGGNNIDFEGIISACTGGGTCYDTYEKRYEVVQAINRTYIRLVNTYKSIKKRSAYDAKVYAVGYPKLVLEGGNCGANVKLNATELIFANQVVDRLNLVIKQAADYAGVHYVNVTNALNGYRLCESSTPAVNGVTYGQEIPIPLIPYGPHWIGAESYHPNRLGQNLIKDAVLAQTANFTHVNPQPDMTKSMPVIDDTIPLLAGMQKENRVVRTIQQNNSLAPNMIIRGSSIPVQVKGAVHGLSTAQVYGVELHSNPIQLGSTTPDIEGNIALDIEIPSTVPAGIHTLHVFGKDIDGENIDVYKTIYVAASETDYDGDGIDNDESACVFGEASGIDVDEDGIDDACDPYIGDEDDEEMPPETPEPDPEDPESSQQARVGDVWVLALQSKRYQSIVIKQKQYNELVV